MIDITLRMHPEDLWPMLCAAFRYALGRRTYMPRLVSEVILANKEQLSEGQRRQLAREVYEQKSLFPGALGDDCDELLWLRFAEAITNDQ